MNQFPLLLDSTEAVSWYLANPSANDALKAYAIGVMSRDGMTNRSIRKALSIDKVYTVTHYKRAGVLLTQEELMLWNKNPVRVTLGHVRAVAKIPRSLREPLLRDLVSGTKLSVADFTDRISGKEPAKDIDIKRLETSMSEALGRTVQIRYNKNNQTGSLKVSFYQLDDLEDLMVKVGFKLEV